MLILQLLNKECKSRVNIKGDYVLIMLKRWVSYQKKISERSVAP
ncbi:hypothetical protein VCRA2110O135_170035 [Vibrio crassostreae]|nr:hypothetical protein VCRA2110O135_170035 [Vibrio crassostreae]